MTSLPVSLRGVAAAAAVLGCFALALEGLERSGRVLFPSAADVGAASASSEVDRTTELIEQRIDSPDYTDDDIENDLKEVGRVYGGSAAGGVSTFHLVVDRHMESIGWTAETATVRSCFRVDVDRRTPAAAVPQAETASPPLGEVIEVPGRRATAEPVSCPKLPLHSPDLGRIDTVVEP